MFILCSIYQKYPQIAEKCLDKNSKKVWLIYAGEIEQGYSSMSMGWYSLTLSLSLSMKQVRGTDRCVNADIELLISMISLNP